MGMEGNALVVVRKIFISSPLSTSLQRHLNVIDTRTANESQALNCFA